MRFPDITITAISGIAFSTSHASNAQTDFGLFRTPAESFIAQEGVKATKSLSTFGPRRKDGSKVAGRQEKNFKDASSIGQEEKSHRSLQTLLHNWTQVGDDIEAGSCLGCSVSLSSDGMIVAIGVLSIGSLNSSNVCVYQWDGSKNWIQLGENIDAGLANDVYGNSVSLSSDGKVVAMGARSDNGNGTFVGHVRVYQWDESNSWIQLGEDFKGETANDQFGYSVSLSSNGKIVAFGAHYYGDISDSGYVRVYEWNESNSWIQRGQNIEGETPGDESGWSVSLSLDGKIVAIGAYLNGKGYSASGHVRVYQWNELDSWIQRGQDIDGEAPGDWSGWSVSLSSDGNIVAIGAPINGAEASNAGHVRVYQWNGLDSWIQLGGDIDGEAALDYSGNSVSLSSDGTIVAIGARSNDGNGSYECGHVRVYQWNGSNSWIQLGGDIDGEAADEWFGYSVSLSSNGKIVAIGTFDNGINGVLHPGDVHVFTLTASPNYSPTMPPFQTPSTFPTLSKSVKRSKSKSEKAK